MADEGVWTTNASIQAKAGTGANATAKAIAATDVYVLDVEALVNCMTLYNWSDAYAALNAAVKKTLIGITSNLCAIYVIQWDMSGYNSRGEAEDMVNILRDAAMRDIGVLRDIKTQKFIRGA